MRPATRNPQAPNGVSTWVQIHWVRNQEQVKVLDGHAPDATMALLIGKRQWRYVWDHAVSIARWEDGIEAWTEVGVPDAIRKLIPSSTHRTVSSAHELRAFCSRSRTLPIGAMAVGAFPKQRNMFTDYRFTRDQREHGAFFNRPIQYTYALPPTGASAAYADQLTSAGPVEVPLYRRILKDLELEGSVAP